MNNTFNGIENSLIPDSEEYIALEKAFSVAVEKNQGHDCDETRLYSMDEDGNICVSFPEQQQKELTLERNSQLSNENALRNSKYIDIVFTDYITQLNGHLAKSIDRVRVTANLVNLTSNVQIGLFYAICKETKAIKPQTTGTEFVKALAELGILQITSQKEVDKIVDGFRLKINGGVHRGKRVVGLASHHALWPNSKDREYGRVLYNSLMGIK